MTEKELKKKIKFLLSNKGFLWFPGKVKFYENDIFGVFDYVFYNGSKIDYIQITTKTNLSHRVNKIINKFREKLMLPPDNSFVYAWDDKTNEFKIIDLAKTQ